MYFTTINLKEGKHAGYDKIDGGLSSSKPTSAEFHDSQALGSAARTTTSSSPPLPSVTSNSSTPSSFTVKTSGSISGSDVQKAQAAKPSSFDISSQPNLAMARRQAQMNALLGGG